MSYKQLSSRLLVITNLYPVPWAPNRASFNLQQFNKIAEVMDTNIIVLVPFTEWLKHSKACKHTANIKYLPYLFLPKFFRTLTPLLQYLSLLAVRGWIDRFSPSTILGAWGFPDAIAAARLAKRMNLPFFAKVHGTDVNENVRFATRAKMMEKYLSTAEKVFCPSQALALKLQELGIPKTKLCVNYNGVNRSIFYPCTKKKDTRRVLFVGTLIPTKGIYELKEACKLLGEKGVSFTLDIVGTGPLAKKLEQFATQAEFRKKVFIHGSLPLEAVANLIRKSDLLVLPSYREGVPNVILEAQACGVPAVATDVGGIPEVLSEENGILIKPRDAKALADGIQQGLNMTWDKNLIASYAHKFDWSANAELVVQQIKGAEN